MGSGEGGVGRGRLRTTFLLEGEKRGKVKGGEGGEREEKRNGEAGEEKGIDREGEENGKEEKRNYCYACSLYYRRVWAWVTELNPCCVSIKGTCIYSITHSCTLVLGYVG